MPRSWELTLGLALFAACGPSDLRYPAPPDLVDGGSVVWAVRQAGGLQVYASEASDRPLLSFDVEGDVELVALVYAAPLSELGLARGPVPLVSGDTCGARALPEPLALYRLGSAEAGGWRLEAQIPEDLRALRYPGVCPCLDFEVVNESALDPGVRAVVTPEPERMLLFTGGRGVWRYDGEAVTQGPAAGPAPAEPWEVIAEGPDRLWVAATDGWWVGYPGLGDTQTATVADPEFMRARGGGPTPAGFEVFTMTNRGVFTRHAPGAPEELARTGDVPANTSQDAVVLWLGPGRVTAAVPSTLTVHQLTGRRLEGAVVPAETRGVVALADLGDSVVALTALGPAFRLVGTDVQDLEAPELATPTAVVAAPHGFIYTGDGGYLQQYHDEVGFCPARYLLDRPRLRHLAWLGADLALVALPSGPSRPGTVLRVRLISPPAAGQ